MAKNIDLVAKKLGATVVGTVPDYSAGAFGMAALANTLRERLEPSTRTTCPKFVPGIVSCPEEDAR